MITLKDIIIILLSTMAGFGFAFIVFGYWTPTIICTIIVAAAVTTLRIIKNKKG